jgi:hypothetical protein
METTRNFTPQQYADGLESWGFLKLKGMTPLFTSAFGDVFFTARNGVWFLDTVGGTLERICKREADLQKVLDSADGQDKYLMSGLVHAAETAGIFPAGDQVLDFTVLPALGGPFDVSNVGAMDFVVKLNITGQLLGQLRKMKPGTKISRITVDGR